MSWWAKIGIISCVPRGMFWWWLDPKIFSFAEITAAQKEEIRVFLDLLDEQYEKTLRESGISFDLINAIEWLPREKKHDAYIIGGSPSMVTEDKPWINELKTFIRKQISNDTPTLWICFGHQIITSAFGWTVDYMEEWRTLWPRNIILNNEWTWDKLFGQLSNNFVSYYSHKQALLQSWDDIVVLWKSDHDSHTVIKVGDNARWVQFHPEFTADFVQFLRKMMDGTLRQEWLNPDDIAIQLKSMANNEWSKVVQLFLKQYRNK